MKPVVVIVAWVCLTCMSWGDVAAYNAPALGSFSPDETRTANPPSDLAIAIADGTVLLSWTPVLDAASYKVEASEDAQSGYQDVSASGAFGSSAGLVTWGQAASSARRFYRVRSLTGTVATPSFDPPGGTYTNALSVTISCSTPGATIRYTLNGSEPNESSAVYSNPINLTAYALIMAKAFKTGWESSPTAMAGYTIFQVPANFALVATPEFNMGNSSGSGMGDELPVHAIILGPYYICKYEVTQGEYQAVMGSNPASGLGVGTNYPVYNVSWYSAIKYCNLRSMSEGLTPVYTISGSTNPAYWGAVPGGYNSAWDAAICNWYVNGYRLPTEAEWEYAARGAVNTPDYLYSGSNEINAVAWYNGNNTSGGYAYGSKPTGIKAANGLGIYDMSGNVEEWCWDWYASNYYSYSPDFNPTGPVNNWAGRVSRGGFWESYSSDCRVVNRNAYNPALAYYINGFRVCRTAQ